MNTSGILIIDNNKGTRESIRMLLEFEGYRVSSCESGSVAFNLVKERCFKVILINYRLPEMKGDDVAKLLHPLCSGALVIGFSVEPKEQTFLAAGADAFISNNDLPHKLIPLIKNKVESQTF